MSERIQVAFASCSDDLVPTLIEKLNDIEPGFPVYIVSEFPPPSGRWVRWRPGRRLRDNLAFCRASFSGKQIAWIGVVLQPRMPYWKMRAVPLLLSPWRTLFFNENLDHFSLRPRSLPVMAMHFLWRLKNLARWELRPGGATYTFLWRLRHPHAFLRPATYIAAWLAGVVTAAVKAMSPVARTRADRGAAPQGISVVIPSRDGRALLERALPGIRRELEGITSEVIIVDNGSVEGALLFPGVRAVTSAAPLSFARAVNLGLGEARFSHVCLLNNDMEVLPGFFRELRLAFAKTPDLFCATAQILFPEGVRRQETGKAVMPGVPSTDFPVRCEEPLPGEDGTWVLYGSGGCSLYDAAKLRSLGGLGEMFEPAYVEDLDVGFRAWQRGWPSVYTAGARAVHHHRATTSRFFTPEELERMVEVNYLRFLAHSVASPATFRQLWRTAIARLNTLAARMQPPPPAVAALRMACRAPFWHALPTVVEPPEEAILALGSGLVSVFPGKPSRGRPVIVVAAPYPPFPLSHGGAVRMYNLMREAAAAYDQVLVCFVEEEAAPPTELLDLCVEIVVVRRRGTHILPDRGRPDVVEEFDSPAFAEALRQTVRRWRPLAVQLEFTQMAQYAADCAPARTVLVEHDVTFDLFRQMLAVEEDWEMRRQYERWREFESDAWKRVGAVVVMSEKDRKAVGLSSAVVIPNGVDLERFAPSLEEPETARVLFIGSFAHLPNVMAVAFLLDDVWPLLVEPRPRLHVIAGRRHRYYLDEYADRIRVDFTLADVEVEDFVADPRPAYRRATVVVAPLVVSAGTNIKIMEAMAMGKAIVSTPAGINGLDLAPGDDLIVARDAGEMAASIAALLGDPERCRALERRARATVERLFSWRAIARRQTRLYESLKAGSL